jgi:hypothetical protein
VTTEIITRQFNAETIHQRPNDGYIDATAMCKACGKRLQNYTRIDTTQEFLEELSTVTQISVTELIQSVAGGFPDKQGTFAHPYVAINLAQWLSPKFSVKVSRWVYELLTTGQVKQIENQQPILPPYVFQRRIENLEDQVKKLQQKLQIPKRKTDQQNFDDFIIDCFVYQPGNTLPTAVIVKAYTYWCYANDREPIAYGSLQRIARYLKQRGYKSKGKKERWSGCYSYIWYDINLTKQGGIQ